ncbi:hypothetical protein ABQF34_00150 [Mycolicibacterium boenickei]
MLTSGVSIWRRPRRRVGTAAAAITGAPSAYTHKRETFLTPERARLWEGNRDFQDAYAQAGAGNASFRFPPVGDHARRYRAAQLQALKPDLIATING